MISPRRRPRLQWRQSAGEIRFGDATSPNSAQGRRRRRRSSAPSRRPGSRTGCAARTATWKIWGNSLGTLDWRADPQNLPAGLTEPWPGAGYAILRRRRLRRRAYAERGEIYDLVRDARHHRLRHRLGRPAQLLGRLCRQGAAARAFEPVGVELRHRLDLEPGPGRGARAPLPARTIRCGRCSWPDRPAASGRSATRQHAAAARRPFVPRVCEERRSADARRASQPGPRAAPASSSTWAATAMRRCAVGDEMRTEFVCIPRPIDAQRARRTAGRCAIASSHRAPLWRAGERPRLEQQVIEGDPETAL